MNRRSFVASLCCLPMAAKMPKPGLLTAPNPDAYAAAFFEKGATVGYTGDASVGAIADALVDAVRRNENGMRTKLVRRLSLDKSGAELVPKDIIEA